FRTRRGYHVADGLDRRVEATRQAMEFAHALGAPIVTNHVGAVPADEAAPEWKLLADVLTDLALYSQRSGTVLCALTGTESGASLGKLLERLPKGLIGVTLDPGNLILSGFEPLEIVEAVGTEIRHVYADDAARDIVGLRPGVAARGATVMLGRGSVDYPALLGALEERQYRGYLSVASSGTVDAATELSSAIKYLRSL
ncbi:MAG TPA: sugar phosphate isomerase/epimerase family protein, partial [Pirellulales bacterium]|nr:sugar phosphate isomerase/epimerase family protein [Pirellulales bacterium]